MPEYVVVQCAHCSVFQVRQRPKNKKFKCSMCQAKQSLMRVRARVGSSQAGGSDCPRGAGVVWWW